MVAGENDLTRLFHRLNNQLGVILANAELLENRLAETTHRARAEQVVTGTLDAIMTARRIRETIQPGETAPTLDAR